MTIGHQVLVVDDDPAIRKSTAELLIAAGYEVSTARDGFDALSQLRTVTPDAIISDLHMSQMSGSEFLSVIHRRFPEIVTIATSGAHSSDAQVPDGVVADAFFPKGQKRTELLSTIAELIRTGAARAEKRRLETFPVCIPRNGQDSNGAPYLVLTCLDCLQSFTLSVKRQGVQEVQETPCPSCATLVHYVIDFSRAFTPQRSDTH